MTDLLDSLRAKAEKATKGPWWVENQNEGEPMEYGPLWTVGSGSHDPGDDDWIIRLDVGHKDDADYVAACDPQTILSLIAVVEAAQRFERCERRGRNLDNNDMDYLVPPLFMKELRAALDALSPTHSPEGTESE